MLSRRQTTEHVQSNRQSNSSMVTDTVQSCKVSMKRSSDDRSVSGLSLDGVVTFLHLKQEDDVSESVQCSQSSPDEPSSKILCCSNPARPVSHVESKKKARQSHGS